MALNDKEIVKVKIKNVSSNPCQNKINFCMEYIFVVVNFLSQVIFLFLLFLGMVKLYANEVETKEKEKLPEVKN